MNWEGSVNKTIFTLIASIWLLWGFVIIHGIFVSLGVPGWASTICVIGVSLLTLELIRIITGSSY